MTEEIFENIKYLKIEIERCNRVLNDLRHWQATEAYAKVLQETRARLISKKAQAEELINGIENDEIRLICKLKFIDLRSWGYIADKLHYDRSTIFKKYKKYITGLTQSTNDNRCLLCGVIIPEGRQVCPICEKGA